MNSNNSSPPVVHWYSHPSDRETKEFVADAMLRFEQEVSRQTGIPIIVCELAEESAPIVNVLLEDPEFVGDGLLIAPLFEQVGKALPKVKRLVLYCPNAPTIRRMAQQEMGIGHLPWGVARAHLAFVFQPQIPQVIWHEMLHTIDADECYDKDRPRAPFAGCTDTDRKCLMQFEPTLANCGDGFPICSRVLGEIRSELGQ